jgi:hypothetical protein
MVKLNNGTYWSFEQHYGYPYAGTKQQKETVLAQAKALNGKAIDPRTNREIK